MPSKEACQIINQVVLSTENFFGAINPKRDGYIRSYGKQIDDLVKAENAALTAQVERMKDAMSDLLFLHRLPDENSLESFERIAAQFYNECGMLRPGKSQSDAMMGTPSDEERRETYDKWVETIIENARTALQLNEGKDPGELS